MPQPRRLIVMRHAKSSWAQENQRDHDRPLNKRGRRDAPRVAQQLIELGWVPQWVTSSDSARTRETYERMSEVLGDGIPTDFTSQLYHGGIVDLQRALAAAPDQVTIALALGHNPGWQSAVYWLSGQEIAMKTATAALLEGNGATWHEALAAPDTWDLVEVIQPREIDD